MALNAAFERLLERWSSSNNPSYEDLFSNAKSSITSRIHFHQIYVTKDKPEDWLLWVRHPSKLSDRFFGRPAEQGAVRLGNFADVEFVQRWMIPQYLRVINTGQPNIDSVRSKMLGMAVIFDRIILPEKSSEKPSWLMSCVYGRFLARLPVKQLELDEIDEMIMLLCCTGETARAIAEQVQLSHRTVEHRLDKLKRQAGARTLPELVAILASAEFLGSVQSEVEGAQLATWRS